MARLCIVTARGGSKRIPRKNIRLFHGRPILGYPIQAARDSRLFDTVMVSTDDEEIADVARGLGADVPFMRSKASASDCATTAQVLDEVLRCYEQRGQSFESVCCCYPTAPFITGQRLISAFRLLEDRQADTVMPVTRYATPIMRALRMTDGKLEFLWPENANARSQDLPPAYFDCGQFYVFRAAPFLQTRVLLGANTLGMEVPANEAQDIDTEEDWLLAELKYSLLKREREDV